MLALALASVFALTAVHVAPAEDKWILKAQQPDGRWRGAHADADIAATSLTMLALLSDGSTVRSGPYRTQLRRAASWLRQRLRKDGRLVTPHGHHDLYGQALGTWALIESARNYKILRKRAKQALRFLTSERTSRRLWRDGHQHREDDRTRAWTLLALSAAQHAEFESKPAVTEVARWLARARRVDDASPVLRLNRTAAHLLVDSNPDIEFIADELADLRPAGNDLELVSLATRYVYQLGGRRWKQWTNELKRTVVANQIKTGKHRGTWPPRQADLTGRVHATACGILTLTVYYRYCRLVR